MNSASSAYFCSFTRPFATPCCARRLFCQYICCTYMILHCCCVLQCSRMKQTYEQAIGRAVERLRDGFASAGTDASSPKVRSTLQQYLYRSGIRFSTVYICTKDVFVARKVLMDGKLFYYMLVCLRAYTLGLRLRGKRTRVE